MNNVIEPQKTDPNTPIAPWRRRNLTLPLCLGLGLVIFSAMALINRYPMFWQWDTWTYIFFSIPRELAAPFDKSDPPSIHQRPVFYGSFIRVCRILTGSLWTVVACQALTVSYLIHLLLAPFRRGVGLFVALAIFLTATTSLPWMVGEIMPDYFTGILGIALFLILKSERFLPGWHYPAVVGICYFSLLVHYSHTPTVLMAAGLFIGVQFAVGVRQRIAPLVVTALLVVATVGTCVAYNKKAIGKAMFSPMGHAYVIARLAQDGIVYRLLTEHCAEKQYRFCSEARRFRRLNVDKYLWSRGLMFRLGGYEKTRYDSMRIIFDSIKYYPGMHLITAYRATAAQMGTFAVADRRNMNPRLTLVSGVFIKGFFTRDTAAFYSSMQATGRLRDIAYRVANTQNVVAWISMMMLLIAAFGAVFVRMADPTFVLFGGFTLSYLISNAFVSGVFSTVLERYQARVVWLAPLAAVLVFLSIWSSRRTSNGRKKSGRADSAVAESGGGAAGDPPEPPEAAGGQPPAESGPIASPIPR